MNFLEMICVGVVMAAGIAILAIENINPMILLISTATTLIIGTLIYMYPVILEKA